LDILTDIDGIGLVRLKSEDVVRHRIVKAIIDKYNAFDADNQSYRNERDRDRNKSRYRKEPVQESKKEEE
jgi:phosphate starvation-inducible PhoH-like protein